ncbi:MAG: acyltransferase [Prevotella sp.]|jgi:peptidoglycan/LPS O-acetylase OafA/YrhL|nr:acyltransferase [Prevotella sp.]MCI1280998.1 acyltransferase [Prevotella sp.]
MGTIDKNNVFLRSKPRYEILDGLRGVAALLVVAFHLFETYSKGPTDQVLNHGYLAVDFFFVLSGFVIGYAYDDRWDRMSTWNFFKRRLIRLHPMVIFGSLIGLLLFYLGSSPSFAAIDKTPWWMVILVFLWCCTMIPIPQSMDIRGWAETNPLNGPTWSLQWEYLANILYALFIRKLSKFWLAVCVGLFALLTINLCLNIDIFHVFAPRSYAAYTVIGGWSLTADQLTVGITRLLYPFFAGLLLSRVHKLIKVRGGFWWCSLLIALLLVMPRIGGTSHMWMNGLYECVAILLLFPLIVSMGAGSKVTDPRTMAVCKFFGEISYPIYITHYPFIYLQMEWVAAHPNVSIGEAIMMNAGLYVLIIFTAYGAYKLYDLPVRAWLKKKLFPKTKQLQEG